MLHLSSLLPWTLGQIPAQPCTSHVNPLRSVPLKLVIQDWLALNLPNLFPPLSRLAAETKIRYFQDLQEHHIQQIMVAGSQIGSVGTPLGLWHKSPKHFVLQQTWLLACSVPRALFNTDKKMKMNNHFSLGVCIWKNFKTALKLLMPITVFSNAQETR
jgi:hypothetical protein